MKSITMSLLLVLFVSCNSTTDDPDYQAAYARAKTHKDIADAFVTNLNLDKEFEIEMVKTFANKSDFIVIYDSNNDSYDAISIKDYDPETISASEYYNTHSSSNYFDLDIIAGHYEYEEEYMVVGYDKDGEEVWGYGFEETWISTVYKDVHSGLEFEKTTSTSKDLAKVAALKEVLTLDKKANFLSSQFGLSLDRSQEVARLIAHWKKSSIKGMTDQEQDTFSTELLGFSITAGKTALKNSMNGNSSDLNQLIKNAASVNSITPEHATKLMTKMFSL